MSTYGTCGLLIKYDPVKKRNAQRIPNFIMVLCKGSICWDQFFVTGFFFVMIFIERDFCILL